MPGTPVGTVIALPTPARAQLYRGRSGAVLAYEIACGPDRPLGRVGLRRERQVDGGLGERELALGQARVLDCGSCAGGYAQRIRVGVADVLASEDHHSPC